MPDTPAAIPPKKSQPFQELRFTRSRQAVTFTTFAALFLIIGTGMAISFSWHMSPWTRYLWLLWPLLGAAWCFRFAVRLTRHAFLLLSPIGIEVFPFFRPEQQMQLFSWGEIAHAEVTEDDGLLILTLAGYKDAKVIIGLEPIPKRARLLLRKAVEGIMQKRAEAAAAGVAP